MAEIFSDADFTTDEPASSGGQVFDESDFLPALSPKAQAAEDSFVGRLSGGVLRGAGYLGDFAQTIADYSPFNIFNPVTQARKQLGAPGLGDYVRTGLTEATKAVGGPEDALEIGKNSWAGTIGEMIPSLLGGPASAIKEAGKKGVVPIFKSIGKVGAEALGLGTTTYGGGEAAEALGVPREYGELAGGIFGAIAPTAVKKVASSTAKTAEQRLTGFDPSKPGRLAGAIDSEGNLIKGAITNEDIIAEQVGKRDIAYRQLEETGVLDEIIGVTDNAESVSTKLAQANGSAGEKIGVITDTLADIEKNNRGLVGSTTVDLKNARNFLNRLSKKPGNKNLVTRLTAELDELEGKFTEGGNGTIKELDNTRQVWGESTKTTYNPAKSAEDKLIDTYNNLVYGALRDGLDNRAKNLGAYIGQPQIADDLIKANKVYSATKNFTNTAFLASQKGLAKQVAGDIIGPRFARAALYGGLAGAGGPVGQGLVLADIARVAATDVFPAQTRALAKGGAKVADLFDIFSRPKAAPIAASKALELDAPATRMGQTKQLDDLRYRSQIHADLAAADRQIDYTGPIKGNPYGGGVITDAAGNPIHGQPRLPDKNWRGDAASAEKNFEDFLFRSNEASKPRQLDYVATPPPGRSDEFYPKAKAPQETALTKEAATLIKQVKEGLDPKVLADDINFSDKTYQVGRETYSLARNAEGKVTRRVPDMKAEYLRGGMSANERTSLFENLVRKRKAGKVFHPEQLEALKKLDYDEQGLSFKTTSNKKYYPADEATEKFLAKFKYKQLTPKQFVDLTVGVKSPVKLNGVDVSPHGVPDIPKDWDEFIKSAPLPESGRVSKSALAALLTAGGVGTSYLPKERGMEEIKPKDMITAEDLRDAVVYQESRGNSKAVSPKGAVGLMQIMPGTGAEIARELGVKKYDLKDPETNKRFGEYYLDKMLKIFKDPKLALAAYNGGPGNVRKWMKQYGTSSWDVISAHLKDRGAFMETVKYVPSVLAKYEELKKQRG